MNPDAYETKDRLAVINLYKRLGIEPADDHSFSCKYRDCDEGCSRGLPLCCGTWPYVGLEYGAAIVRGKPTRILFIAMDRGSDGHELMFPDTQEAFRKAAEQRTNWHMGGVALLMAGLLDDGTCAKYSLQFALTNAVKCVLSNKKNMNANLDRTMICNCANHLWSEIEDLRPHLIITQGTHPRETVVAHYSDLKPLVKVVDQTRSCQILRRDHLIVLTTPHPARQRGLKYKRGALGLGQGSMPPFWEEAIVETRAALAC